MIKKLVIQTWNKLLIQFGKVDYSSTLVEAKPKEEKIPPRVVVVVGHKFLPKWALMQCPCGCKEILTLSLMKNVRPFWCYKTDKWNRITLSPSVWKNDGCRSHFFIRKGKIVWCED